MSVAEKSDSRFSEYVQKAKIRDLGKLRVPVVTPDNTSVREIIRIFESQRTGSVLVSGASGEIVGIFTERDLLRRVLGKHESIEKPVKEFISMPIVCATWDTTLAEAIKQMTAGGFRHLPIFVGKRAEAVLSCRTMIRHITEVYPAEVFNLPPKFNQKFDAADGA